MVSVQPISTRICLISFNFNWCYHIPLVCIQHDVTILPASHTIILEMFTALIRAVGQVELEGFLELSDRLETRGPVMGTGEVLGQDSLCLFAVWMCFHSPHSFSTCHSGG